MREGAGSVLCRDKEQPFAWLSLFLGCMWRLDCPCLSDELGERGMAERSEESNEPRSDTVVCVNSS